MQITREFVASITKSLNRKQPLIDVVIGPRQVGKTTGIKQLLNQIQQPHFYVSADGDLSKPPSWITQQWLLAQQVSKSAFLVIDEIQKIENWAEVVKQLWDEQVAKPERLKVILLGSSSLELQKGLSESLAGRFFVHKVYHWTPQESFEGYAIDLNQYLRFGGYPGSYSFVKDKIDWINYVQNSIIDAVIGKDILSIARVKSPALFKQCFYIACSYAAQEISYTKLLGQLQDKGNTELVKYYLELFEQAFLLKQLYKYSNKKTLSRSSSPKILPLCPALYSITLDADYNPENTGRAFEVVVGSLLARLPGELSYWRHKNFEVDYVLKFGKKLWAIEVKSNLKKSAKGLYEFKSKFPTAELIIIDINNFATEIQKIDKSLRE